jgi:NadR type nicotinamide-nucleotide adenylyltransferase
MERDARRTGSSPPPAGANTGLVLGKFLPPHAGHLYLVETARREVEHLTVVVCSLAREPIPGALRFQWMRELVPGARVVHVTDEDPSLPEGHPDFWDIWLRTIRRVLPRGPDVLFTSESSGDELARRLGARHRPVDPDRQAVPVSGSRIREAPDQYWSHIPPVVRPHFVTRVVVTGSESTGKTTLAKQLAEHFQTVWVPEFGRGYVAAHAGPLTAADFDPIARGQAASEDSAYRSAPRSLVILDTDLLTTEVYADHYFGSCPAWVRKAVRERLGHLYLLTAPDVPWIPDPGQRDRGDRRDEMHTLFDGALRRHGARAVRIAGSWTERFRIAVAAVERQRLESTPARASP